MRNTNYEIKYLAALPDKNDPQNSTGLEIANTVNGLIDLMGAMEDVTSEWPEVDPSVVTATSHDSTYPYLAGSEVRLPYAFFRAIQDVPANSNVPLTDRNYWTLFYLPSPQGSPYTGFYSATRPYLKGHVAIRLDGDYVTIIVANKDIDANVPFSTSNFDVIAQYDRGGMADWGGVFSDTGIYLAGVFVIYDNKVWISKTKIEPGAWDPAQWELVYELDIVSIFLVKLFVQETMIDDEVLYIDRPTIDFKLPANLPDSVATCGTSATADSYIDIKLNDVAIGHILFSAGATDGTFSLMSETAVSPTDELSFVVRGTADTALADLTINIHGIV